MTQTTNHIPYDNAPANHMPGVHPSAPVGLAGSDDDEDDSFNIRDFLLLCLTKWRWFVVSILIFIGLGVFYILSTPKTYTREASVLIKDHKAAALQRSLPRSLNSDCFKAPPMSTMSCSPSSRPRSLPMLSAASAFRPTIQSARV